MTIYSRELESLGLVYLDRPDANSIESSLLEFDYNKEEARSRVDPKDERCHYRWPSSSVRLNGLKRVGISNGRAGRTRKPNNISGFCFEYLDGRSPVYVGQWYQEIAHLDLDPGDRITSFTFWEELEDFPDMPSPLYARNGKYSGVRIEKSGAGPNAVELHPGEQGDIQESTFAENYFERLDGFVWGLYSRSEQIQVVTKPSELARSCLSENPDQDTALYTPSDKLFWKIQDEDGAWTRVSQINVFFNPNNQRLCGLEFIYRDGQLKRACYTEGTKAMLVLGQDEELTGASWKRGRRRSGDQISVSYL
ncbi:hypothetical protein IL306_004800 [Fusarium sp. DS 682]|nr:hypothetical protein IL306_004800 [Fusarium sp. DS 682]